jgi:hypothetical protein
MDTVSEKAVGFATAAVSAATAGSTLVELREQHEEWTEFRLLRHLHFVAWTWVSPVSIAISRTGTVIGWVVEMRRAAGSAPLLDVEEIERLARGRVRQIRTDPLLGVQRVPIQGGGSYAIATFAGGWVAINHETGSLIGHMPTVSGDGQPVRLDAARTSEVLEAAWWQLDRDVSGAVDSGALDQLRSSMHFTVIEARSHDHGVLVCDLGLWTFHSTFDVSLDTETAAIVRWHHEALSEPGTEGGVGEIAAVRVAQEHVSARQGLNGPIVNWQDAGVGGRHAHVYWWHAEDQVNVEGDYVAVMVNGATGKVFSVSDKWRAVDLPRMRAASRITADQAQAIADAHMGSTLARFQPGALAGLNVIELTTRPTPSKPEDRLVWRRRYRSLDGVSLVELSVDCETGRIVRSTGW